MKHLPIALPTAIALVTALACSASHAQMETYLIDPAHTYPSFEADHMGISIWRGKLNRTTGSVQWDKAKGRGTLELTLELASIDFGLEQMNAWAMSDKFFDVAAYPTATYKGSLVDFTPSGSGRVTGELTLRGITKPVELRVHSIKCIAHPLYKRELCGADASASFNRDDFGLDAGKPYGFSMQVLLRIQVEALADR